MLQRQSPGKADSLKALAKARFNREFTAAEEKLLAGAGLGQFAYCGPNSDRKDPLNDPGKAEKSKRNRGWGRNREIAADLIRWLCVDRKANEQVDPSGLQIQAAKIIGYLDLAFVMLPFPIRLWNCALTWGAYLNQVEIPEFDLGGSWTKAIVGDSAIVKGSVVLDDGFHANGEVNLVGAQIGGSLGCDGGTFNKPDGYVKGGVFLRNGFHADGKVNLMGAQIGGNLECDGGTFNKPDGYALHADGAVVKGGVFLGNGFHADGDVRLLGAQIGGSLDCDGGTFNKPDGDALNADSAKVSGSVFLRGGFNAKGYVDLTDAHIDRDLICIEGILRDATLDLRGATVSGIRDNRNSWP
jgi:hypothetical protein